MPLREENSRKEETTWSVTVVIGYSAQREGDLSSIWLERP